MFNISGQDTYEQNSTTNNMYHQNEDTFNSHLQ